MDLEFPKRRGRVGERARGRKSDSTPYALGSMLLLPLRRSKLWRWTSDAGFPREWKAEWARTGKLKAEMGKLKLGKLKR
jgi:hypothetical protein